MRRRELWDTDELDAFLAASTDTRVEAAWHLLADAGMRVGEVLALRWADVDTGTGRINVRNAVVGVSYAVLAAPPTGPSVRAITASPEVMGTLRRHRWRQDAERAEWGGYYRDGDLVVCREDGRALHPRVLHRAFRHRVAAAGLPDLGLADLRRSRDCAALQVEVRP